MQRKKGNAALLRLKGRLDGKLSAYRAASSENEQLRALHDHLLGYCDALEFLRDHQSAAGGAGAPGSHASSAEQLLLVELSALPRPGADRPPAADSDGAGADSLADSNSANSAASNAAVALDAACARHPRGVAPPLGAAHAFDAWCARGDLHDLVCPPSDPFLLFKWLLAQPPYPGAASVTAEGMVEAYKQGMHEATLQLAVLEGGVLDDAGGRDAAARHAPLARLRHAITEHLHLCVTLARLHRAHMISQLTLTNTITGEVLREPNMAVISALARRLELSDGQLADISTALAAMNRVLDPLLQECRQLQQQLAAADGGGGGGADAGGGCSTSSMLHHLASSNHRRAQLDRLSMLQHKGAFLRVAMSCQTVGYVTWAQLTKMSAWCSPYIPNTLSFAIAVAELHAARVKERAAAAAAARRAAATRR
ncbi:hypothetical protein HT031_003827 [Scenedesmus sp. PABB004]|nr:hypothetical protein HT031_003827 [Scenedesmus sp. PABB004]